MSRLALAAALVLQACPSVGQRGAEAGVPGAAEGAGDSGVEPSLRTKFRIKALQAELGRGGCLGDGGAVAECDQRRRAEIADRVCCDQVGHAEDLHCAPATWPAPVRVQYDACREVQQPGFHAERLAAQRRAHPGVSDALLEASNESPLGRSVLERLGTDCGFQAGAAIAIAVCNEARLRAIAEGACRARQAKDLDGCADALVAGSTGALAPRSP